METVIVPYKKKVAIAASKLADRVGIRCHGQKVIRSMPPADLYINWGGWGYNLYHLDGYVINHPEAVKKAANKLTTLRVLHDAGITIPPYVEDPGQAAALAKLGARIVVRRTVHGCGGKGVEILHNVEVQRAPLYTLYLDKDCEARVHVWNGQVIDYVEKVKRHGTEQTLCWNYKAGYVFTHNYRHNDIENCFDMCIDAVRALGLDFGAVDVIHVPSRGWFILEINTAPGLAINRTYDAYEKQIREIIGR